MERKVKIPEDYDWMVLEKVLGRLIRIITSNLTKEVFREIQKEIEFNHPKFKKIRDKTDKNKFLKTFIRQRISGHLQEIAFKIRTDEKSINYLTNYILDKMKNKR